MRSDSVRLLPAQQTCCDVISNYLCYYETEIEEYYQAIEVILEGVWKYFDSCRVNTVNGFSLYNSVLYLLASIARKK